MARDFYPFVEEGPGGDTDAGIALDRASCSARIAVYDDAAAAPRVVIVDPKDTRAYLEEITATVTKLSHDQGGSIPFMVIREVVENLIHAYFREPAISILADGNTIRFADQGPGIREKARALEYGTTSATEEMKHYIRGVGSGLPYAQQYLQDKGGSLEIEDNIIAGTIVTISLPSAHAQMPQQAMGMQPLGGQAGFAGGQAGFAGGQSLQQAPGWTAQGAVAQTGAWQQAAAVPAQGMALTQQGAVPQQAAPVVPQGGYPSTWQQAAPQVQVTPQAAATQQPQMAPFQQVPATQQPQVAPFQQVPATQPAPGPAEVPGVTVSDRGRMVLSYLAQHESVGPTELVGAFGLSQSTWTRELKNLEEAGIVAKRGGQKRFLTQFGRTLI